MSICGDIWGCFDCIWVPKKGQNLQCARTADFDPLCRWFTSGVVLIASGSQKRVKICSARALQILTHCVDGSHLGLF